MVFEGSSTIREETIIILWLSLFWCTSLIVGEGSAVGRGLAVMMEYALSSLPAVTTSETLYFTMGLTVWSRECECMYVRKEFQLLSNGHNIM